MSTPEPRQDSHCAYCGAAFPEGAAWPRRCARCGNTSYRNPLPVAVALVNRVTSSSRIGLCRTWVKLGMALGRT
ncbi:hypothetical protein AB0C60_21895, partial [Streptomyces sp. NPDC048845]